MCDSSHFSHFLTFQSPFVTNRSEFALVRDSIRLWFVVAVLLCLLVELVLLGILPNPLEVDPVSSASNGRSVPHKRVPRKKSDLKTKFYHHHMSHASPSTKKATSPRFGFSLDYLLQGATNDPSSSPIYLDDRINTLPNIWGWEPRCMPGYGRSGFSLVSPHLSDFSTIVNPKNIPQDIDHYRFPKTVFSNATGEHWAIGKDVGLSVWSSAPVYRYSTVASPSSRHPTHLSFIATRPTHPRDKATIRKLSFDQSNTVISPIPKPSHPKKGVIQRAAIPLEHSQYECLVYTDAGTIILSANVSLSVGYDLVVVTCNTSILSPAMLKQLTSPDSSLPMLALHDKALNIFWNHSKPCNPPRLRDDVSETQDAQSLISNRKFWQTMEQVPSHSLSAVLIIDEEKPCYLTSWLSHARSLGIEHIYVYKQVHFQSNPDEVDKLLLPHVRKDFVTVVPFFDAHPDCNHPDPLQRLYRCPTHGNRYYPLYQDAVQRFRAKWMFVTDSNELIALPHASIASTPPTPRNDTSSNGPSKLAQALERSSRHWGRHITQASLSGHSVGSGRGASARPYCIRGDESNPFTSPESRSESTKLMERWILRTQFPFVISEPTMRIYPDEVRLDRYLRQFQGALPQNNVIQRSKEERLVNTFG